MSVAQETAALLAQRANDKRKALDFMNQEGLIDGGLAPPFGEADVGPADSDSKPIYDDNDVDNVNNYDDYEEPSQVDKFMAALEKLKSGGGAVYINIQNLIINDKK